MESDYDTIIVLPEIKALTDFIHTTKGDINEKNNQ